ncbi:hypothetical protein NXX91_16835 [Bacteroides thetaiotaomicron]|nr:hypothetical protein [Bacteroides thetaiotaomicron]
MTMAQMSQLSAVGFAVRSAERGGTPRRETSVCRRVETVSRARRQAQSEGGAERREVTSGRWSGTAAVPCEKLRGGCVEAVMFRKG